MFPFFILPPFSGPPMRGRAADWQLVIRVAGTAAILWVLLLGLLGIWLIPIEQDPTVWELVLWIGGAVVVAGVTGRLIYLSVFTSR